MIQRYRFVAYLLADLLSIIIKERHNLLLSIARLCAITTVPGARP